MTSKENAELDDIKQAKEDLEKTEISPSELSSKTIGTLVNEFFKERTHNAIQMERVKMKAIQHAGDKIGPDTSVPILARLIETFDKLSSTDADRVVTAMTSGTDGGPSGIFLNEMGSNIDHSKDINALIEKTSDPSEFMKHMEVVISAANAVVKNKQKDENSNITSAEFEEVNDDEPTDKSN